MKKLSLCIKNYALCIIMSLYMVSCGGDNGGDDNNGGSGEEQPQEIAGYRYVDLGLPSGLKWAVHNMGATSPTEYGDYWTSTSGSDRYGAHALAFDEDGTRAGWGNGRYIGRTIRPVSN